MSRAESRRVGVALDEAGLVAVGPAGAARHPWPADAWRDALDRGDVEALAFAMQPAFRALHAAARGARELVVALAPPLAQTRQVELPPMRADEAREVLARDAARYFVGVGGEQAIALSVAGRVGAPPVAVAARDVLLGAVHAAARAAGWSAVDVVPAHAA
ncbi:MAG TPA: hypothetical protein VEA99_09735, partial [Gemmatimonadaceae bacterium]|nr:hypothetical protein [Gemmatimonadaceae bacterium]